MSSVSFQSRLIGSWDLICYKATSIDDPADIIYPLGEHCKGRGIFTADGYNSAHIQAADIVAYAKGREFQASGEELANAARKTLTYTAKYRVEEHGKDRATIYYDIDVSLPPNWIGATEVRDLEIEENEEGTFLYLAPSRIMRLRA